jgi:REP element-mobilizing transposase RayT
MTRPGMRWRHVIINTLCSWLHGDERGFRSRRHRIHSSGDYRNPPPEGEHAGLHQYHVERSREEVTIAKELRKAVGVAIMRHLLNEGYRVLAVAVGKVHTHGLIELPENLRQVKAVVGEAKRKSSRAVKKELPGNVWAASGTYKPVETSGHLESAFGYILYEQGADAWTWSFRDRSCEGMFGRKRLRPRRHLPTLTP